MTEKHGNLSIDSDNLFPIIKKWLYSDHDIFYRELISNGCDAITKLKKLDMMGEYSLPADYKGKIQVLVNPDEKTIKIIDNGLGMTADEVEEYISRIAFSGATDFIEKYKDKSNDDQIIGHFGLGFYSAFMVADEVTIDTLSYKEGSTPVHWSCDGGTEYNMEDGDMDDVGTEITLYLNDDCLEFANEYRAREVIEKYCSFMPTEIYLAKENAPEEYETIDKADKRDTDTVIEEIHEDAKYEEKENDKGEKEQVEVSPAKDQLKIVKRPVPLNDTTPLWTKSPNECTDEEYKEFYRKVFLDYKEPLFWIHLNMDYPFNLKGILYFPKIRNNFEIQKNKIQLYSNQVYVTDQVEGIVPEYLTLLHGVIDSPDIPLNVSRSYLQSDSNVKKISNYITRKVADRLQELFTTMRADYEQKWDDLKIFIEYGIITDEKFAEKAESFMLWKTTEGKYFTAEEYKEVVKGNQTDKNGTVVFLYVDDPVEKNSFLESAKAKGYDVLVMDGQLDNHYVNWYESKHKDARFVRVDSDVIDKLIQKDETLKMSLSEAQQEIMRPVFESQMPKDEKIHYNISFEAMAADAAPVVITQNEFMRRMKEMAAISSGGMSQFYSQMPDNFTIAVNGNNPIVIDILADVEKSYGDKLKTITKKIDAAVAEERRFDEVVKGKKEEELTPEEKSTREELSKKIVTLRDERDTRLREIGGENKLVKQIIDLALLSNGLLKGKNLTEFIQRSISLIEK